MVPLNRINFINRPPEPQVDRGDALLSSDKLPTLLARNQPILGHRADRFAELAFVAAKCRGNFALHAARMVANEFMAFPLKWP